MSDLLDRVFSLYSDALRNEAMRLFPPVPGGSERRVPHHGSPLTVESL